MATGTDGDNDSTNAMTSDSEDELAVTNDVCSQKTTTPKSVRSMKSERPSSVFPSGANSNNVFGDHEDKGSVFGMEFFSGAVTDNAPSPKSKASSKKAPTPKKMTIVEDNEDDESELTRKRRLLTKLRTIDKKVFAIKPMTMANTYDEIRNEYDHYLFEKSIVTGMQSQRNLIRGMASGAEILSNTMNSWGYNSYVDLNGWSSTLNEQLEDQDEIFKELYEKYGDVGMGGEAVPVEVKLAGIILSSAFIHSYSRTNPEPGSVMTVANLVGSLFGVQQKRPINLGPQPNMGSSDSFANGPSPMPNPVSQGPPLQSLFSNMMGDMKPSNIPSPPPQFKQQRPMASVDQIIDDLESDDDLASRVLTQSMVDGVSRVTLDNGEEQVVL